MSPFAIKMLAVLGLLCVLVQDTTAIREYAYGAPGENETAFVTTRRVKPVPFFKRKVEVKFPEEFYLDEDPLDFITGVEVYQLPEHPECEVSKQIKNDQSTATVKLESARSCGINVKVTFRVLQHKQKEWISVSRPGPDNSETQVDGELSKIPDQDISNEQVGEESTKIPDQNIPNNQVDEESTKIPDQNITNKQFDEESAKIPDQNTTNKHIDEVNNNE